MRLAASIREATRSGVLPAGTCVQERGELRRCEVEDLALLVHRQRQDAIVANFIAVVCADTNFLPVFLPNEADSI